MSHQQFDNCNLDIDWILVTKKNEYNHSPCMTDNQKRSVLLSGHRTSISLEQAFWIKIKEICKQRGKYINQQITEIDNEKIKKKNKNLSSAIRVYILEQAHQRPCNSPTNN